mmetsp:Transcript_35801/g.47266  ORF Transcript_35801/g.47266 Transcript_35801/m.47266 type:complete len:135 (+) Transcript_35801:105-509(+)
MALKNLVMAISDQEAWEENIEKSENLLILLDCHQGWCGPSESMNPTFQRIFMEYEDSDKRILFRSVDLDVFKDNVDAMLPEDSGINLATQGCMPFFILLRFKQACSVINGANAPELLRAVDLNIPDAPKEEEDM